ncbi:Thioredoxin domain-containing protein 5 [Armadillidium nasatum]|uniref:Thioredoxin domain-containing protein 5 n=1 Tax=Armadillidium nasatum TaxID=96803 RepID=A0A5N5TP12_9CRUS|nr:Thioredoxin domain-containing protein 5 [Armadillidium nasatum]
MKLLCIFSYLGNKCPSLTVNERCGHCKKLHPTWDQLGSKYNKESGPIRIGKLDCTQYTSVCAEQQVNGYPTLKYRGPRDLASLEKLFSEQLGIEYEEEDVEVPQAVSGLVEFTDTSFQESVVIGKFFHKRLEPTWASLAKSFEHDKSVIIGKLDCTKYKTICTEYEVKGYPTLLWIEDGKKIAKYSGDRSHEDLKRFVVEQLGERRDEDDDNEKERERTAPTVVTLTGENIENAISIGTTFIKYYAPWCGHCKRLAPIFEELGKKFVGFEGVTIAKVDCTQEVNRDLCSNEKINGFPTLILYKDGEKQAEYNGDRSLSDMAEFITSRLTHDEL